MCNLPIVERTGRGYAWLDLFNDPDIAVDWPLPMEELILSDKDRTAPRLVDIQTGFVFA